jgi:uncharacterized membrane protein YeaQ/YmgE (transglycosylase-associated protein family)
MTFTFAQFVTWLIVGLLGGSAAGMVVKRQRKGFGTAINMAVGAVGAIIGGVAFRIFSLFEGLSAVSVSLRDLLSAFSGSFLVLGMVWIWQRYERRG